MDADEHGRLLGHVTVLQQVLTALLKQQPEDTQSVVRAILQGLAEDRGTSRAYGEAIVQTAEQILDDLRD